MQWFPRKPRTAVAPQPAEPARRPTALLRPLEPRIMFDGAIAATVDAVPTDHVPTDVGQRAIAADNLFGTSVCGVEILEPAAVAPPAAAVAGTTVVFVDARVQDAEGLLQNLTPGTQVVYLDAQHDGLQQIADYLATQQDIGSIQIIAHGNDGDLNLGSTYLYGDNLAEHAATLAAIGSGIAEGGDILIYACNTAGGEQGLSFVNSLAQLTGRDIAASDDRTGYRGDFALEISTGSIEATPLLAASTGYDHDLALLTVTSNGNSGAGTLRNTIALAMAGDTITFNASMSISLTSGELVINKNLTIDGDLDDNGTADVTLDANYVSRVLSITAGTVNLDGLVIREGRVSGNGGGLGALAGSGGLGGGISITGGTVTIRSSTITANVASGGGGGGSGAGYSYGGGGGGGFNGIGGGNGGAYSNNYLGSVGGGGVGGMGGFYNTPAQAGKGGSTVGGAGGSAATGFVAGGAGGTAGTIGGGGGGAGASLGATGGAGGVAAGGIYIGTGATLFISSSTVSNNLGAGGGGGGGFTTTGGNGGDGVGGIFNAGTLNYQSSTVTFTANVGAGGTRGNSNGTAGTNGASFTNLNTGGTINSNFNPNAAPVVSNLNGDSVSFTEGGSATLLDAGTNATVTDADSADFSGGNVTVAIVTNRVSGEDVLAVNNQGTSAGQIGVSGSNITFGGTTIGTFTGGTGTNNLVITLNASATPAAVQALVRNLTYSNSNTTEPSTATRTVRVTVNDGDGGTSSNSDVSVSVVGVNDAPTLSATGGTPTYTENGSAVDLFSAVSISTVESGQTITGLTLTVSNVANGSSEILRIDGTDVALTNGNSGTTSTNAVSYSVSVSAGTATVTLSKVAGLSTANAQTLVDGISYRNASEAPDTTNRVVTLTSITDSGGTSNGGVDTTSLSIAATVAVVAVNDAPTLSGGPYSLGSTSEDTTSAGTLVSTILAGLTYADADSGASSGIAITASTGNGTWQYSTDGTNWNNIGTVSGSAALLLSSTTQVRYIPDGVDGETATLTFRAWDMTTGTASGTFTRRTADVTSNGGTTAFSAGTAQASLSVTAVNDAPTFTATSGAFNYTENGSAVDLFSSVAIDPIESGQTITTLTLKVQNLVDGSNEILNIDGIDIALVNGGSGTTTANGVSYTVSQGGSDAFITLTKAGGLSAAAAQTVLDGITYRNASDAPDSATARFVTLLSVTDSGGTANGGVDTINVNFASSILIAAVNDAPTITAPGSISVTEDVATAITGISFADVDANAGTVTLSVASGALAATSGGGVTVGGTGSALTLTGSLADINTFIAGSNVTFTTASNATSNVTLTVDIDDGGSSGTDPGNSGTASSEAASTTVTLSVTAVNDAPVVSVPATALIPENASTALTGISFSDVDAGSASVTATLSVTAGALAATSGGGVTVGGTSSALTLTGSIANINTYLAGSNLSFTPANGFTGTVTLTTSIDDGGNTGAGGAQTDSETTTLTVTAINDRPDITAPGSIAVTEDVAGAITGISFSDTDAGAGTVTVTLAAASGTLAATSGGGVTVAGSGSGSLTLSGSIADINTFIAASNVSFTTAANATSDVTLTVTIDDGGNTGADPGTSGTATSEDRTTTVTLQVTAVNDAPVVTAPATLAFSEDTTGAVTGISFADVDAGSASVTVTFLVPVGTLAATSGGGVTVGGTGTALTLTGSVANINTFIAGSNLTFTPVGNSTSDVTLTTSIDDGGNTGSGGAQTHSATTTLSVAAINDQPTITAPGSISITEDVAGALTGISFADIDAGSGSVTVTLAVASGSLAATSGGSVTVGGTASALTLTGSIANINAFIAASGVSFTTAADATSNVTLTVSIDDGGNTGADPGNSGTGSSEANSTTVTLQVTAVNDAPVVTAPATLAFSEDTAGAVTGISFADVDAGSASVTVTFSIPVGTLAATSGGGVTVGGTSTALTLTGSIANINTYIAGSNVTFTPVSDSTTDVTLTTSIDDGGNTGSGGAQTHSATSTLSVAAINDQPSITAPGSIAIIEDVAGALTGISFADIDAGSGSVTVTLSVASGSLAATSGSGVIVGGTSSALTLTGSIADINTFIAASGVSFTTAANATANVTLTVSVDDGGNTGADPGNSGTSSSEASSTTVTLQVTAVNDAPVVNAPTTLAFSEDTAGAVTGITFSDVDAGSASVSVTLSVSAGTLAATSGGGVTVGGTSTALTLTGSVANINTFIAGSNVTFTPGSDSTSDVTLTTSIDDGGNTGSGGAQTHSATTTLSVAAINDQPSITAPGSIAITEDLAGALTGISFADIDAGSGSVTVTLSVASGSLAATSGGGVTVGGTASALTLTGSVADINTFIAASGVSFTTAANATANVTLTVSIDDGGNTGADPGNSGTSSSEASSTTVTLQVTAVNDAPVVNAPTTLAFSEDTAGAVTGITFSDVDAGSASVSVTLSVSAGTLAATSGGGVTVGGTSGALTLTGSLANINTFIAGSNVTFMPGSDSTGDVTLTTSIDDGGNTGSGGAQTHSAITTLSVAAINDQPTITAPGSIAVTEDVAGAITGISFADSDAGSGNVTVTLSTASGTLAATSGSGVTVAGSGSNALTLSGSVGDINAFIAASGVSFTTAANATGNVTLNVSIDDAGNTGVDPGTSGTATSEDSSTTITLVVAAVNDAPLNIIPSAQDVNQDASLVFNAANGNLISISDVDATGAVQVTLTAANGTLTLSRLNGLSFSAGDGTADTTLTFTGSLGDINAALNGLTFTPTGGYNGAASLQISVDDQGGSGGGGAQTDSDTIAITVDPIESRITDVSAVSANGSYGIGNVITFTVSFDSVVNVDASGGLPTLQLETGSTDRVAVYSGGSGSNTLTFQYVVQAGDVSGDLDYTSTAALALNGATIRNASSLDATLDLPALGADSVAGSSDIVVDGVRPTASIVIADPALAAGESSVVTITFSEAVSGFSNADLTIANGTLSAVSSADGGITWTATFTPSANITDTSNVIVLDAASVQDAAGNTNAGSTVSNNYVVDTALPTATIVVADTALAAGESTQVTITFSEAVSGFSNADLTVANGTLSAVSSSDGGITWTATLTPTTSLDDATNLITLNNTGVTDAAGNTGVGSTSSNNYAIETTVPAVVSVVAPADGSYVAGQSLDFTVNLSEAVLVDTAGGVPRIAITLDGGNTIFASYVSGSGSTALVFRASVTSGLLDLSGVSVGSALDLNGAHVRDAAGNAAQLALNDVGGTTGVRVDAVAPLGSLTLVGNASPDATTLTFELKTTEAVSGVDATDFRLLGTGSVTGQITGVVQIDAQTYRVTVGNVQGEGTLALRLAVASSGIVDAAGNALSGVIITTARDVDTIPAPVQSSDTTSSPPADAPKVIPSPAPLIILPVVAPINTPAGSSGFADPLSTPTVETILASSSTPANTPATDTPATPALPTGSLVPSAGGYVSAAGVGGGAALQAVPDLGVYTVTNGPLSIALPSNTFTVAERGATQISVEARLANGQPLPSWLKFDARSGTLSGKPPAGFNGSLDIQVTARDGKGNRAASMLHIDVKALRPTAGRPALDAQFKSVRHAAETDAQLLRHLDAAARQRATASTKS